MAKISASIIELNADNLQEIMSNGSFNIKNLQEIMSNGSLNDVLKKMISKSKHVQPNEKDKKMENTHTKSDIFTVINDNNISAILQLIAEGVDMNVTNDLLRTPLHVACYIHDDICRIEIIELLLTVTSNINAIDIDGCTPLYLSTGNSHAYMETLLEENACIDLPNHKGDCPISKSVRNNCCGCTDLLLKYKPKLDIRDEDGQTPLIRSIILNNIENIINLLSANASPDFCNIINEYPLDIACKLCDQNCVQLLIDHNVDINKQIRINNEKKGTICMNILGYACKCSNMACILHLFSNKWDTSDPKKNKCSVINGFITCNS